MLANSLDGGTVKHASTLFEVPFSERSIKQALFRLTPFLKEQVQAQA